MTRKPAWITVGLGAVLAASSGVTINRVGGSAKSQLVWFTLSFVLLVAAGIVARWKSQERQDFRIQTTDSQGRPPKLGEVPLGELGVHQSQVSGNDDSAYIRRDIDSALDEAVSSGQSLVAVSGAPLAGRTRALAEAARRYSAGSWLVRFEAMPGASLTEMISAARRVAHGGSAVLWLENPDLGLLSQLSAQVLDQLPSNLRIFMTVDANLVDTLALPSDALSVLSAPGVCTQLGLISESERDRLAAEPTYSVIAAAHDEEPILMGRLMISLDRVTEALRALNEDAVCRIAILRAAVDWQRAGVPKSLTPKTIEKLYRDGYWNEIGGGKRRSGASKSHFNHAMESLLAPWNDHGPQLLDEAYSGRAVHLRAHRLLTVVAEDPQHPPGWAVSDTLWNYLTKKLGHSDRLTVGLTAYNRGDYGAARKMLEVIDPMVIPAAVMLAVSLHAEYTGDVAAARNWYLKTVDSGDATVTGIAMVSLGALEQREGLLDDARGWYLRALDSGDPTTAGIAMVSLGGLAEEAGCLDDARGWYLRALDSGDPTMAGMAMLILGGLEYRLQRINDARRWYIKALGTHDLEVEPPALHQLGDLERGAGRVRIARRWYLKAIETDHPLEAPHALVHMGELEMEAGHISNARNWFVRAAESANPDVAAIAMYKLGEIGEETKNIEEACRWYHDAIDHGHPEIVPKAEHRLGHLEYKMGHFEIARQLFAAAAGSETDMASGCMIDSGHLEEELGNIAWARRWYLKAIKADDEFYGPHAMCDLGDLEEEAGRIRQARHWYRKAANAALPAAAGKAMCSLGRLEERIGHTEKARGWYLKAIEADHKCAQDALDQLQAKQDITQRVDNFMKYGHSYIDADHEGQASAAESPASVCGGDAAVTQILKTQMPRMRMQKVPTSEAAAGSVD